MHSETDERPAERPTNLSQTLFTTTVGSLEELQMDRPRDERLGTPGGRES